MDAEAIIGLVLLVGILGLIGWSKLTEPERIRQEAAKRDAQLRAAADVQSRAEALKADRLRREQAAERQRLDGQQVAREQAIAAAKEKEKAESEAAAKASAERAHARERLSARVREFIAAESVLTSKLCELAFRNVSLLDEYGDQNWDAVEEEAARAVGKLKKREGYAALRGEHLARSLLAQLGTAQSVADIVIRSLEPRRAALEPTAFATAALEGLSAPDLPEGSAPQQVLEFDVDAALADELKAVFRTFYDARAANGEGATAGAGVVLGLDGVAYEAQVMTWLRELGVDDVRGTPRTGDQGADVVFTHRGRRVAVQCKRYKDKVSNKAVQEVHAARSIYKCSDAWVVTTSVATPGGREAAQVTRRDPRGRRDDAAGS